MLLGNGFSTNLSASFSYNELFKISELPQTTVILFEKLQTSDFEFVLSEIQRAIPVVESLIGESDVLSNSYNEIKIRLIESIATVHPEHWEIPHETLLQLRDYVWSFKKVFTTNYDLVLYWALLLEIKEKPWRSKDFFWSNGTEFDPLDTDTDKSICTLVYYLHGALHLWRSARAEREGKSQSKDGATLLEQFNLHGMTWDRNPLFVSEGSSNSKKQAIDRSNYLRF